MTQIIKIKVKYPGDTRIKTLEVEAELFGPLAVHKSYDDRGYRISHIKTGWTLTGSIVQRRSAIALAKKLVRRPKLFVNLSTTNSARNKDAAAYLMICRLEMPPSFREYDAA